MDRFALDAKTREDLAFRQKKQEDSLAFEVLWEALNEKEVRISWNLLDDGTRVLEFDGAGILRVGPPEYARFQTIDGKVDEVRRTDSFEKTHCGKKTRGFFSSKLPNPRLKIHLGK